MAPTALESHQPVLYTSLLEKSQLSHWPKGHQWNATKSQHCQAGLNAPGKGSRANSQHLLHPEPPALSSSENTFHYIQHNSQGAAVAKEDFLPLSARWSLNYASSGTGEEGVDYKAGFTSTAFVLLSYQHCVQSMLTKQRERSLTQQAYTAETTDLRRPNDRQA